MTATYKKIEGQKDRVMATNRSWIWYAFFSYYSRDTEARSFPDAGGLFVNFSNKDLDTVSKIIYNVIDTDYDNYTIVYNCSESWTGLYTTENLWILGREPTMSQATLDKARKIVNEQFPDYDHSEYGVMCKQENCEYE